MQIEEWSILIGALMSGALSIGPWMFKVHAKLAVIAARVADLCDNLQTAATEQRRLWDICARHESQLAGHAKDIARLEDGRRGERNE